jgi:hypothetical protein
MAKNKSMAALSSAVNPNDPLKKNKKEVKSGYTKSPRGSIQGSQNIKTVLKPKKKYKGGIKAIKGNKIQ